MVSQDSKRLGAYLSRLRNARDWGVREAARAIGISHTRLIDFENGIDSRSGLPCRMAFDTMLKVAAAFAVPVTEVLQAAGYDVPDTAITPGERTVLGLFKRLPAPEQERVLAFLAQVVAENQA